MTRIIAKTKHMKIEQDGDFARCVNIKQGATLGDIQYYRPFKGYAFSSWSTTSSFSKDCIEAIAKAINIMNERRKDAIKKEINNEISDEDIIDSMVEVDHVVSMQPTKRQTVKIKIKEMSNEKNNNYHNNYRRI